MRAIKNVTSSWNWPNLSASNCCTCPPTRPTSISSNACGNSSRRIVCTRPITTTLRSSNRPSHPVSLKLKPHTGPPSTPCFPTASRPLKNQKLCQCRVYLRAVEAARRDWIIYYEPRRSSGLLSSRGGRQSYFATACISEIIDDNSRPDHFYALIDSYLDFPRPVPFAEGGHYHESALRRGDGDTNKGAFG